MADVTSEPVQGHCPQCGPDRNADIVSEKIDEGEDGENGFWWHNSYRILQCCGCQALYFQKTEMHSEDRQHFVDPETGESDVVDNERTSYWPAPSKRVRPDWEFRISLADIGLGKLFIDIYTALDNNLDVLAAIGMRTVFDRASELLGVDPAIGFEEKLDNLLESREISTSERDALIVLIDAGSAAAHRGWRPSSRDLNIMMSHLEAFLYRSFVQGFENSHLGKNIPPKPQRRPKKP